MDIIVNLGRAVSRNVIRNIRLHFHTIVCQVAGDGNRQASEIHPIAEEQGTRDLIDKSERHPRFGYKLPCLLHHLISFSAASL